MKKVIQIVLFLTVGYGVAVLAGNKSERALDIEKKIEMGVENPSRN